MTPTSHPLRVRDTHAASSATALPWRSCSAIELTWFTTPLVGPASNLGREITECSTVESVYFQYQVDSRSDYQSGRVWRDATRARGAGVEEVGEHRDVARPARRRREHPAVAAGLATPPFQGRRKLPGSRQFERRTGLGVCGTCTTPRARSTRSQRSANVSPRRIPEYIAPRRSSEPERFLLLPTIGGDCPEDIHLLAGDGCP